MNDPIIVFACSRSSDVTRCSTSGCGGIVTTKCSFALRGRLAGKTCDQPLCAKCGGDKQLCPPHQRLSSR